MKKRLTCVLIFVMLFSSAFSQIVLASEEIPENIPTEPTFTELIPPEDTGFSEEEKALIAESFQNENIDSNTSESSDSETSDDQIASNNIENLVATGEDDLPVEAIDGLFAFNNAIPAEQGALLDKGNLQISEFTGAASYGYDIDLPKGRGGLTPSLQLSYSSQNTSQENLVGFGWNLSQSEVKRNTALGIDRMYSEENEFMVSLNGGGTKFVFIEDTPEGKLYRPKYEMSSLKLYKKAEGFELFDGSGNRYVFGSDLENRERTHKYGIPDREFSWKLERIEDSHGNEVVYSYDGHNGDILIPHRIQYNKSGGSFTTEVKFFYEARPDTTQNAKRGFLVENDKRINRIEVFHDGKKRKAVYFHYEAGSNGKRSLLKTIEEEAFDSAGVPTKLPEITFDYEASNGIAYEEQTGIEASEAFPYPTSYYINGKHVVGGVTYDRNPYDSEYQQDIAFVDYNGDGLTDMLNLRPDVPLSQQNYLPVAIHNGENGWTELQNFADEEEELFRNASYGERYDSYLSGNENYFMPTRTVHTGRVLIDVNGDHRFDIVEGLDKGGRITQKILLNDGTNHFVEGSYQLPMVVRQKFQVSATSKYMLDLGVRFADINGDGLVDIVQSFDGYLSRFGDKEKIQRVYINTGSNFVESDAWEIPEKQFFIDHYLSGGKFKTQQLAQLFDINGDGMADMVKGSVVYLNNGESWEYRDDWEIPFSLIGSITNNGRTDYVDHGVRLADLNGDGLTDAIRCYQWQGNDPQLEIALNTSHGFVLADMDPATSPFCGV